VTLTSHSGAALCRLHRINTWRLSQGRLLAMCACQRQSGAFAGGTTTNRPIARTSTSLTALTWQAANQGATITALMLPKRPRASPVRADRGRPVPGKWRNTPVTHDHQHGDWQLVNSAIITIDRGWATVDDVLAPHAAGSPDQ